MTQQKEIQEAQNKQLPGRSILQQSVLSDYDITTQENQYAKVEKESLPFIGQTVTKVTLEGASHEDPAKLADVLKMPAAPSSPRKGSRMISGLSTKPAGSTISVRCSPKSRKGSRSNTSWKKILCLRTWILKETR